MRNVKSSGSVRKWFPLPLSVLATEEIPTFRKLLNKFANITKPSFHKETLPHSITHHITTIGPPVHNRPRRLAQGKSSFAKDEFTQLMQMCIIRPSKRNWVFSLHMVPESGSTWRACDDYRALNSTTKPDRYPIPHIHDVTVVIQGKPVFTKCILIRTCQ